MLKIYMKVPLKKKILWKHQYPCFWVMSSRGSEPRIDPSLVMLFSVSTAVFITRSMFAYNGRN